jgi:hypothetical protein
MKNNQRYTKTIMVRMDNELLDLLKGEVNKLNTDMSTYVRWCIQTGIYLDDLNQYFSKGGDVDDEL